MLGHLGINVPDLDSARAHYGQVLPWLGFEPFVSDDDQFPYRPAGGQPRTFLFFYRGSLGRRPPHTPRRQPPPLISPTPSPAHALPPPILRPRPAALHPPRAFPA